jgi:hypothetical protein
MKNELEEKFWETLKKLRNVADKYENKWGKDEIWQEIFDIHSYMILDNRPLTKKEIEFAKNLVKEVGLVK